MGRSGAIRIGISGWRYAGWRGVFYPKGLRQADELRFAARTFRTIEINGTFYSLQDPGSFARWAAEAPDDFIFAVKGPRFITHMKRLADVEAPLANFLANGLFELGPKLGPILWQLPARFRFDAARVEGFLARLPRDTEAAARLARRHDARVAGRTSLVPDRRRPMRHAIEVRHESFLVPEFIELLRRQEVALVCADSVDWPCVMDLTADFVYCRLHGATERYASGYDDPEIETWAARVAAWARGGEPEDARRVIERPGPRRPARDVFVYFDNDAKVRAPFDAERLAERLRVPAG